MADENINNNQKRKIDELDKDKEFNMGDCQDIKR